MVSITMISLDLLLCVCEVGGGLFLQQAKRLVKGLYLCICVCEVGEVGEGGGVCSYRELGDL